ncbi:MobV family relaxase, partial [Bacillus badius]|uniref:MobV family relaxase n=1 Tax=Bacillus badius TaxID=1455 RepID=UPI002E1FF802
MSYAVVHMEKMKAYDLKGMQFHHQRERESRTNPDIAKERSRENYDLVNENPIDFNQRVKEIIESQKTGTRKTRKDAVLVNELLVTSDREFFDRLDPDETRKFFKDSLTFFQERYGKQNIAYAVVHMDEKTPHMHMGVVPMRDGRLQSKNVFNRQELLWLQDKFPEHMQKMGFELERGEKGFDREHLSVQDFKRKTAKEQLEKEIASLEKKLSGKKNELLILNEEISDEVRVSAKREMKKVEVKTEERN